MPQGIVKESFERYYESRVKEFEIKDRITEIKNMKFTISLLEEYIDLVDLSLMDVPMR